jgi:hypothetical protein
MWILIYCDKIFRIDTHYVAPKYNDKFHITNSLTYKRTLMLLFFQVLRIMCANVQYIIHEVSENTLLVGLDYDLSNSCLNTIVW